MKKKAGLMILIILISLFLKAQNNTDRLAGYKNDGQHLQTTLRGWHDIHYNGRLKNFNISFSFLIYFQIDTTGHLININFNEEDEVPAVVRDYAVTLLQTTNGFWKPQIRNCRLVTSDTITCKFFFAKKQSQGDWVINKEEQLENERKLDPERPDLRRTSSKTLNFKSYLDNHCWVVLGYN